MAAKLAIIGAGSWGTALSIVLAPRFAEIALWAHEPELAARMREKRVNDMFLTGFTLLSNIQPTADLGSALENADIVIGVMPSRHARAVYCSMLPYVRSEMRFASATKGLEPDTLLRMTQVAAQVFRPKFETRIAALSGPTFAREVARGEPAAVVIASEDRDLTASLQQDLAGPTFRLYTNPDPIGVEVGAALKNIIAIGSGICQGLGLGNNTLAALITRGLAEVTRLAVAMGGQPKTLAGLAGLGDLVLTCTGDLSRNRGVGIQLAKGRKLSEIVTTMTMVAEGVETVPAAIDLARKFRVNMPITEQMDSILRHGRSPKEAIRELMERALKEE